MSDVLNVVVALVVIIGIFRWWSKPDTQEGAVAGAPGPSLGFRPRNVTPAMISSVQSAFPQEPRENIHYDLLKTGNVQITSNKLLEKGFLPPPPAAYYTLYPRSTPQQQPPSTTQRPTLQTASSVKSSTGPTSLISRYGLENRLDQPVDISISDLGKGKNVEGKSTWLDTAEKREASLRERKAQMVLAARQRLLEKQKQKETAA